MMMMVTKRRREGVVAITQLLHTERTRARCQRFKTRLFRPKSTGAQAQGQCHWSARRRTSKREQRGAFHDAFNASWVAKAAPLPSRRVVEHNTINSTYVYHLRGTGTIPPPTMARRTRFQGEDIPLGWEEVPHDVQMEQADAQEHEEQGPMRLMPSAQVTVKDSVARAAKQIIDTDEEVRGCANLERGR